MSPAGANRRAQVYAHRVSTNESTPGAAGYSAVTGSAPESSRDPVRHPETPAERLARRKAWGATWGANGRRIAAEIRALDARTTNGR